MADANNYAENLSKARKDSKNSGATTDFKNLKSLNKALTPMGFFSLIKEINILEDLPFMAAIMFAVAKDILDFVFTETVILPMLFSMLCSIFIFMMLLLAGSNGKRKVASGLVKKGLTIIGGGIADAIPGLDFLPIETVTAGAVYFMTLLERANAKKQ